MARLRRRGDGSRSLDPWRELEDVETRVRRMFGEMLGAGAAVGWSPSVEISETDDELLLTAELPGMTREDIEIEVEDDILTLRGEKKEERRDRQQRYHVWERRYGAFERSFPLPRSVDPGGIQAEFRDGVLRVHLPKTEESRGRRIEIAEA